MSGGFFPDGSINLSTIGSAYGLGTAFSASSLRGRSYWKYVISNSQAGDTFASNQVPSAGTNFSLSIFPKSFYLNPTPLVQTFTSGNSISAPANRPTPTYIRYQLVGGGGGGGSGGGGFKTDGFGTYSGGGGGSGSSGGYVTGTVPYGALTCLIGTGGAGKGGSGGGGATGDVGGQTTLIVAGTVYTAAGGRGGGGGGSGSSGGAGGGGGGGAIVTGGIVGNNGSGGGGSSTSGNFGGGAGGAAVSGPLAGYTAYGGSGSGGVGGFANTFSSQSGQPSAAGSAGIIVITWYFGT
jgi:hypothetical protein